MILTESIFLKKENLIEADSLCFLSKNLFNAALYAVRQHFFNTSLYLNYNSLQKLLQDSNNPNYRALPSKVSQKVLQQVDMAFRSFFNSNKSYKLNPSRFKAKPQIPKYMDKSNGRNLLQYTIQAISKTLLNKGIVKLSGTNISVKTKIEPSKIKHARLFQNRIEICYEKEEKESRINNNVMAIDLGVNNLASITTNQKGCQPLVVNGRCLKSINQYYNKIKSTKQSLLEGNKQGKISKSLKKLTCKRNLKIKHILHCISKAVVSKANEWDIAKIVIGKNDGWKQECNMGKKNNQNFVSIPFNTFINMVRYKAKLEGIEVEEINEAYTSKCSFIDLEEICRHEEYKGYRKSRGMYRSKVSGREINADINGSYNILRKVASEAFAKGVEGFVVNPVLMKVNTN